jgi:hypothetical protein
MRRLLSWLGPDRSGRIDEIGMREMMAAFSFGKSWLVDAAPTEQGHRSKSSGDNPFASATVAGAVVSKPKNSGAGLCEQPCLPCHKPTHAQSYHVVIRYPKKSGSRDNGQSSR